MSYQPGAFSPTAIYGSTGTFELVSNLPTGTWNVMGNGRVYQLEIHSVSGGRIDARLNSGTFKDGSYDADSGTVKFTRVLTDGMPQYWIGYLMYHAVGNPQDPAHRIAGTIHQPNLHPDTRDKSWYATLPRRK